MSRTLPRAAGGMPGKLVSLMTLIAGADDTERSSRRMREDSSAENCERQVTGWWISVQNFLERCVRRPQKQFAIRRSDGSSIASSPRRGGDSPGFARNED